MELKTILAIVLCLVMQGARFTCTNGKKNNGRAAKGADNRPFSAARKGA